MNTQDPLYKVLIVEDTDIVSKVIKKLLQRKGYQSVNIVESGKDALKLITKTDFDVILIDLGLPDMNGFELVDLIHNKFKIPSRKMVVMTGAKTDETVQEAEKHQIKNVMGKPISMNNLITNINNAISQKVLAT